MYSGSTEFNNLIKKTGGNALITRFKFSNFTLTQFTELEYYGGSNNSDDIAIGTTNMAYLDVSTITNKLITNQEFLFEVGMELSDGTIEYAPMGYFTVQKPDSDEDTVNFKAYDRMQKFEKSYVSSLAYPTNSSQILNEVCTMCGVELATPITRPIAIANKLEGYTCREVLGYVAGIHGKFACFDRYGKLNLRWYSATPIEKQISLIWALTKSQSDYKIEKITIAKDTETTYTSGTGISGINHSNPYATQAIASSIYSAFSNFTYRPCEISMLDDIQLDPWDMLKVTCLDGSVLTIPVMSLEHSFTSGETKVKSVGKTDAENEYNYSGPVTQAMDRMATELLVANRIIATKVDAEWVNAHTVTTTELQATNARVETLETSSLTAEKADLRYATITNLNAQTARIEDLEATALTADSAIITNLQTDKLNTSDLNAEVAKLGYLTADSADLKYANITFGNIDTANIDVANIGLLFTKVGLIDRATIVDGHITGFLDAVEINASNITAGTLIADRILLKGSESGLLYALNNLGELTSTTVDTLDGTILTQRTVTADKLVANSITANELDVTNIFGNSAVLTTLTSQAAFINAISTNSIVVGASNKANNALNAVNGLEIGGRNLLIGSEKGVVNKNADTRLTANIKLQAYNGSTYIGTEFIFEVTAGKHIEHTYTSRYSCDRVIIGHNGSAHDAVNTFLVPEYKKGVVYTFSCDVIDDRPNVVGGYVLKNTKLEKGNKATDWTPAPEDTEGSISKVNTKAQGIIDNIYTPNTTTIDGGKITTNSIKASSIDVNNLFAQNITATGSITGATILGATIGADSGHIGCMSIDALGRLVVDIDGDPSQTSDYILMEYGAHNADMTINGTSGLTPRGLHTYRQYSYSNIIGTINTNPYDRYDTETVLTSDGFRITNNYYDGMKNVGTLYSFIDFTAEKEVNTIYTLCDFKFDKVKMNRLIANGGIYSGGDISANNQIKAKSIELSAATSFIDFHYNSSTADFTSRIRETASGVFTFQCDSIRMSPMTSGEVPMFRSSSGVCQFGAASDSHVCYISGSEVRVCDTSRKRYEVIKASAFTISSSKRLKMNVEKMTDEEANKIYDLDVVTFDYINGEKNQRGLIAEDAYQIIPSLVQGDVYADDDDYEAIMGIGIDYSKAVPYLIKAIQTMKKELDEIKATQ